MSGRDTAPSIVYKVTHTTSGKAYIGVTTQRRPQTRWAHHCNVGRRGLGAAIKKYGRDAFSFEIIASARTRDDLLRLEAILIAQEKTVSPHGYNLNGGGNGTLDASPETRRLIGEANRRRNWSEESKAKVSNALREKYTDPVIKAKMIASARNRSPVSASARDALSKALRGKPKSVAWCKYLSARQTGRVLPLSTRAKIAETLRARAAPGQMVLL